MSWIVVRVGCPIAAPAAASSNDAGHLKLSIRLASRAQSSNGLREGPRPKTPTRRFQNRTATVRESSLPPPDDLDAHIWLQRLGHHHASVGLLVVLDDSQPGSPYRQAAAIQRVDVVGLSLTGFRANRRPARLVRLEIRAGRNLFVPALPGQPHLDVVGLGRARAH